MQNYSSNTMHDIEHATDVYLSMLFGDDVVIRTKQDKNENISTTNDNKREIC
jgi:hypothetical protein